MSVPLLSLIIPAYNCEPYIVECIASVLKQLPPDCELILVDDGSTDATAEKLTACVTAHPNAHLVSRPHKGASAARNAGLDAAHGRFVTFVDCDDCLREGFLAEGLALLSPEIDLCIFGIERVPLQGNPEYWTVSDCLFPSVSDFADKYIRTRQLMVYSNCNKFYRRSIIEEALIRFEEDLDFGEDRLFNYLYLAHCEGAIRTSRLIMLRYIQRSTTSLSSKHVPHYFDAAMRLHDEKMRCFLKLSQGTSFEEKRDFVAYDISREVEHTVTRFAEHPEEIAENLPAVNALVFGERSFDAPADVLLVLGSHNCKYKARAALKLGIDRPDLTFVLSGGNPYKDNSCTEAEFMAAYLTSHGIREERIYLENRALYTRQNLELSAGVIRELEALAGRPLRLGIMAGGFHIPRIALLVASMPEYAVRSISFLPAYSPNMKPENWFKTSVYRDIILTELRKTARLSLELDGTLPF